MNLKAFWNFFERYIILNNKISLKGWKWFFNTLYHFPHDDEAEKKNYNLLLLSYFIKLARKVHFYQNYQQNIHLLCFNKKVLEKLPTFQALKKKYLHFFARIGTCSSQTGRGHYSVPKTSHFDEILWPVNDDNSNWILFTKWRLDAKLL